MILVEFDGETTTTRVVDGRLVLSTDDARCVARPDAPCRYTIKELRISAAPFRLGGASFTDAFVVNDHMAFGQQDRGAGIQIGDALPFWVLGKADGRAFGLSSNDSSNAIVRITDLVVRPTESHATVMGELEGEFDGKSVHVAFSTTADAPFENRPPFVTAPPPVTVPTSCIAEVPLPPNELVDVDDDLRGGWYEVAGNSVGAADEPLVLPPGEYALTLAAADRWGALGFDQTRLTIVDDGRSEAVPGAVEVAFEVPAGADPEQLALAATDDLQIRAQVEIRAKDGSAAAVASLDSLVVGEAASVGETYAAGSTTLNAHAIVRGALHAGGPVTAHHDAQVEGGVVHDGPYTPGRWISFLVRSPPDDVPDVLIGPGQAGAIEPGAYGTIQLSPNAHLALAPGVYSATELRLEPGSELIVAPTAEGNPTVLVVTDEVESSGRVSSAGSDRPALLLAYLGAEPVPIHQPFEGWVVAPNAKLTLHRGSTAHRGAFVARTIVVQAGSAIEHIPLTWDFVRRARGACAIEPVLTCVRPAGNGRFTAVFGYRNALPHFGATVPAGPFNRLDPPVPDVIPREAVLPRGEEAAFEVEFDTGIGWILGGREAVATPESRRCP